jgi:glycosyltransferase involved in cell wall biosynthesis
MNLWLINHYASPPSEAGGTRHHALGKELTKRGHRVAIIAGNLNHFSKQQLATGNGTYLPLEEEGVRYLRIRVPAYNGNSIGRVWSMAAFAWRLRGIDHFQNLEAPEIIVGSTLHLFAAYEAYRLAHRLRIPFVLEVRDLWPQTLLDLGKLSRWHPFVILLARIEKYLYRHSDHIITLLPFAADHIVAKGGDARRITWIPNGVDFSLVPAPTRPRDGCPFVCAYAGSIGLANGVDLLLDVAARIRRAGWADRIQFRIFGEGNDKAQLMKRTESEGLSNVCFEQLVPKSQIFSKLQEAHALFINILDSPIYRWGFSMNKLFDYLAVARPILIVTSARYNPVKEAQAGVTCGHHDVGAIANALESLATMDPTERWEMGLNGYHFARKHHSFDVLTTKLETIAQDLLARR